MQQINNPLISELIVYAIEAVQRHAKDLTAGQRVHMIAVLCVLASMKARGEPATARKISEVMGTHETKTGKIVNILVSRGVLLKERTTNPKKRGIAFELSFAERDEIEAIYRRLHIL